MSEEILSRLKAYDRPLHSHLPKIGAIEYIWVQVIDCLYQDGCETWRIKLVDLGEAITKYCPPNREREQALHYLAKIEEQILKNDLFQASALLEITKFWARTSIIRE